MTSVTDLIDERTAARVAALLDYPEGRLNFSDRLPLMWQIFYHQDFVNQSDLGADGHPAIGNATPEGTRRMFAGGRVTVHPGMPFGEHVRATTEIVSDTRRQGRAGSLRFVTHRTTFTQADGTPVVTEERNIVYIPMTNPGSAAVTEPSVESAQTVPAAALEADVYRAVEVDTALLFRFSALTLNTHRIHYDRAYACDVEGYPGLVVHGPLQALMMAEIAREGVSVDARSVDFVYRLVAPLYENAGMFVTASANDGVTATAVMDSAGKVTATGTLSVRS
jgi:3-methylfumaryl-CoA hydratase